MNAAEHIVEAYFRICCNCFTVADVKVQRGNNRQLDLLATNLKSGDQFHVEIGVTHQLRWNRDTKGLFPAFDKKFFGNPSERVGPRTDHSKGKKYFDQILDTYRNAGFEPSRVQRVWVCWVVTDPEQQLSSLDAYSSARGLAVPIVILSLRDSIIPRLQAKVATSNYDDEVLRTLSLLKQQELQRAGT